MTDTGTGSVLTPEMVEAVARLGKTYPAGRKGVLPTDIDGRTVAIRVLPQATPGASTPYSVTRHNIRGRKYLCAEWTPTRNRAEFSAMRDATRFLDMHYYAVYYRRVTGMLPAWATESR